MNPADPVQAAPVAIFDIDGTLIRPPSAERRFARFLASNRLVPARNWIRFALTAARRLPRDGRNVLRRNVAYLQGLDRRVVAEYAERWTQTSLAGALVRSAHERLLSHQRAGDPVVLLSGTPDFLAAAIGGALGVACTCGSTLTSRNGRYSADVLERHLYGTEKVVRAAELCEQFGWNRDDVVCYADAWSDRPILEWAGRACVVDPSPQLRTAADDNGWEILES